VPILWIWAANVWKGKLFEQVPPVGSELAPFPAAEVHK
jgi:hypothetical protein